MDSAPPPAPSAAALSMAAGSRPLYQESSQYRHWRFSRAQLNAMREKLNRQAVDVVRDNMRAEADAAKELSAAEGSSTTEPAPPPPGSSTATSSSSSTPAPQDLSTVPYLTPADELLLIRYYASTLPRTCAGFGFPEGVEASAVSFFKRFYLWNTCMDYHPRKVMPTCLFLALKTENATYPIADFVKRFSKLTEEDVLALEFTLAQSLKFEFALWHAHKALKGFFLDCQSIPEINTSDLIDAVGTAAAHVASARQTDLELLYAPSQIALACLSLASPPIVSAYLLAKYAGEERREEREKLERVVQDVGREIVQAEADKVDMARVKDVDRRLRTCTNPEKVPGSALYRKRRAEEELEESAKRAAKQLKDAELKARDAAVFGGSLIPIPPALDGTGIGSGGGAGVFDLGEPGRRVPLSPRPGGENVGVTHPVVEA